MPKKSRKHPRPKDFPMLIAVRDAVYHLVFVRKLEGGKSLGMCDYDSKTIFISRDQEPAEMHATFWHEYLHAVEHEYNVSLGHPSIRKLEWAIVHAIFQLPLELPKQK